MLTEEEKQRNRHLFLSAAEKAKKVLKPGDKIRVKRCHSRKSTITFVGWDGHWIVSKSGVSDYSACGIDRLNGQSVDFTAEK